MIFLAPLQGFTDFIFRNVYSRHYTGIDIAVSPFIPLTDGKNRISNTAKDLLPANNQAMLVIPQLLGNKAEQFIHISQMLHDWGYNILNWNLGCPVKNVTRKKRGSGLLPHPELVREILEKIIPLIPQLLSIKLRLGLNNTDDIYKLIPVLNDFPLENIIIHPRISTQMYEGEIHHDVLQDFLPLIKHEIVYNGDIFSLADFQNVRNKYPTISKWMIGRGVFCNPLLPAIIKGNKIPSVKENDEMFLTFLLDLYNELQIHLPDFLVLDRIKDLWKLFSKRFSESENVFDKIAHSHSLEEIILNTKKIICDDRFI